MSIDRLRAVLRWSKHRSVTFRYLATAGLVILGALLRLALDPWLAYDHYQFILFFPAVTVAALLFEHGSGLFATLLSAALAIFLFSEPRYSFALVNEADVIGLFVFLISAFVITLAVEAMRLLAGSLDELEAQKNTLLHELNHRIRNNLQIISSALAIQGMKAASPEVREALGAVSGRIATIARLQHHLFAPGASESIEAAEFLRMVCEDVDLALIGQRPVTTSCAADDMRLERDFASALGIMVNELMTNALKYAFPDGRGGNVTVDLKRQPDGDLTLAVSDDGIGCSAENAVGTGSTLVTALARQLGGTVEWGEATVGCSVVVRIPAGKVRAA